MNTVLAVFRWCLACLSLLADDVVVAIILPLRDDLGFPATSHAANLCGVLGSQSSREQCRGFVDVVFDLPLERRKETR